MADAMVSVPPAHVDALREALLEMHRRCMDELRHQLARYGATHDRLEAVEGALVELRDVHEALDQIGWRKSAVPAPVVVTLHAELLADIVAGMPAHPGWLARPRGG